MTIEEHQKFQQRGILIIGCWLAILTVIAIVA